MLDDAIIETLQKRVPDAILATILATVIWLSRKKVWGWGYQLDEKDKQIAQIRAEYEEQLKAARALAADYKKERDEWKTHFFEADRQADSIEQRFDRLLVMISSEKKP